MSGSSIIFDLISVNFLNGMASGLRPFRYTEISRRANVFCLLGFHVENRLSNGGFFAQINEWQ